MRLHHTFVSLIALVSLFACRASAQSFFVRHELGGFLDVGVPKKAGAPPPLVTRDFSGVATQRWTFEPSKTTKGAFVIRSASPGNPAIDVFDPARGARPALMPFTGATAQLWKSHASRAPNFFNLVSLLGPALDVPWHTREDGLPVDVWPPNDFFTQHWQALPVQTLAASAVGLHCPTPTAGAGDFGGSPFVRFSADAELEPDGSAVRMRVRYSAELPMGTVRVAGDWSEVVFRAPPGQKVVGVLPESRHSEWSEWAPAAGAEYGSCNAGTAYERHPTSGPVSAFTFIADTGSLDFNVQSFAGDCGCDAQLVRVLFHPLALVLAPLEVP